jgi:hypothetical protein
LTLPALTGYAHQSWANSQIRQWRVEGTGSELRLPALKTLLNGTHYQSRVRLDAVAGGRLVLPGLEQITDDPEGDLRERQVNITADGLGSQVDLSGLRNFVDREGGRPSTLAVANGGTLMLDEDQLLLVNVSRTGGAALHELETPVEPEPVILAAAAAAGADASDPWTGLDRDLGSLGGLIALASEGPPIFDANEIRWIGEADGMWSSPTNWSIGRVPGPGDNVVIHNPNTALAVTISNITVRVRGLYCTEALVLASGSLTVHGRADVEGDLTLRPGSTLIASGEEARFIASGSAVVNGGNFIALKGGQLDLPTVFAYSHASTGNGQARTFLAVETGSRIEFAGLTRLSNGTHYDSDLWFQALAGGTISLPQLRDVIDPPTGDARRRQIIFDARGQASALLLPAVQSFHQLNNEQFSWIRALDGAVVEAAALREATGLQVIANGTGLVPLTGLTYLTDSRLDLSGQSVNLPNLREALRTVFQVSGVTLETPVLGVADGSDFLASHGGRIVMEQVRTYRFASSANSQQRTFRSLGAGSLVSLPNLRELIGGENYNSVMQVEARAGGEMLLTGLREVREAPSGDFRLSGVRFLADGISSRLDLSQVESIQDADSDEYSTLSSLNGGWLRAPSLRRGVGLSLVTDGSGVLDSLTNIVELVGGQVVARGAAMPMARLQNAMGTTFEADGVALSFPALQYADGAVFRAHGGGQMTFPALERYAHASTANHQLRQFLAMESGSRLSFPALRDMANGTHHNADLQLYAVAGGQIDMPLLEQMNDPEGGDAARRQFLVQVEGFDTAIRAPLLEQIRDRSADERSLVRTLYRGVLSAESLTLMESVDLNLNAESGALLSSIAQFQSGVWNIAAGQSLLFGALSDVRGSTFVIDGHAVSNASVARVDGASFVVRNGGSLLLPGVSHYTHDSTGNGQARLFRAEGNGSRIEMVHLASMINGTHYDSDIRLEAIDGGQLDFRGLRQVTEQDAGDTRFRQFVATSSGIGSRVDLGALAYLQDLNTDQPSLLVEADGGTLHSEALEYLTGVDLTLIGTNLTLAGVREIHDSRITLGGETPDPTGLRRVRHSTVTVEAGDRTLSSLVDMDGSSLVVSGGARLSLPSVTVYSHESTASNQTRTWRAEGAGSRLELTSLLSLINGTHLNSDVRILAEAGGVVDVPALGQIVEATSGDARQRDVGILATGEGSQIHLTGLRHFRDANPDSRSSLAVAEGGAITVDLESLVTENVNFETLEGGEGGGALASVEPETAAEPLLAAAAGSVVENTWQEVTALESVRFFLQAAPDPLPPATIRWVGGSGNWTNVANWDLGRLPRANDMVLIQSAQGPATVTLSSGSRVIGGLDCQEDLIIAGGSLTVRGPGEIRGALSMGLGTSLVADGAMAALQVAGPVVADGANFYALYGGRLEVANLASYNHGSTANNQDRIFLAFGQGSRLLFPALVVIANGSNYDSDLRVEAVGGGVIGLPLLTQLTEPTTGDTRLRQMVLSADGAGSVIQVPSLVSLADRNADEWSLIRAINGGAVETPALREVTGTQLVLDGTGTINVALLANLTDGSITLHRNANVNFPLLVNLAGTRVWVNGAMVTLGEVQNFDGGHVFAQGGGSVTLSKVLTYAHMSTANGLQRTWQATGLGSLIHFPELRSITSGSHYDSDVVLEAVDGGRIQLPKVLQMVEPEAGDTRLRSMMVRALGRDSVVDLRAMVNFQDINSDERSRLEARRGGAILSNALRDVRGVHLVVDPGSSVQTGEFFNFVNGRIETQGVMLNLPKLVTATGTEWLVDQAEVIMATIANVNGGSFRVSGGGRLSFPAVASYLHASTANGQRRTFVAIEDGSRLEFPALRSLVNGEHYDSDLSVEAVVGGHISLPLLEQVVDPTAGDTRQRQVTLYAAGIGSEVDLTRLANLIDQNSDILSSLNARWGGRLVTPALQTLQAVDVNLASDGTIAMGALRDLLSGSLRVGSHGITNVFTALINAGRTTFSVDGGVVQFPELVTLDGGQVFATGGGRLSFPKVLTYSHASTGNGQTRVFSAIEGGTELVFGGLQSISNGTHNNSDINIQAMVGARIDMSSVIQIFDPSDGDTRQREIVVQADGYSSQVLLTSLGSFVDANPDVTSRIRQTNDGEVDYPAGASLVNVVVE